MQLQKLDSGLLRYLVEKDLEIGERLPSLTKLSGELGISVGKLREQLELARQLEIVSVRPRTGIRREPYRFAPGMLTSLLYGLASGDARFSQYSVLRQAVEASFWDEAVRGLTPADMVTLRRLVASAWQRLRGDPVHIPSQEHRALHLTIFGRLDNPFVFGLLEAYWDAYEASEMTRFATYSYWVTVWTYHERIVEAVAAGHFDEGRRLLVEHFDLLRELPTGSNGSPRGNGGGAG